MRLAICSGLLFCVLGALFAEQRERTLPDFARARDEAVRILQSLIRIDTSNPPGNETKAAEYLKSILNKEGIPSEILALEPARANLVARLKGSGKKRPLLLMGHTDVVGVERDKWTVDPFAGVVRDGFIYGRGAMDDKDTVTATLMAFLLVRRMGIPLQRDLILLAEAGEEGSMHLGIDFVVNRHWDKIDCEYALAEGGSVYLRDGKFLYATVTTTEKVPRRLKLVARGTPGHGSVPRPDNPVVRLGAALARIGQYRAPIRLNEATRAFFKGLASVSTPEEAFLYSRLEDPVIGNMVQEVLRGKSLVYDSLMRTSLSPTIVQGGFRNNVIPAQAEATIDIRAVPDEDVERLFAEIEAAIGDPAVELVRLKTGRPAAPPSRIDSELFRALEKAHRAVHPGAITLPSMLTGATDMAQLRAKGVQAYGVGGIAGELDAAHGNDERISIDALGKYVELVYRAVVDVAGP